MFQRKFIVGLIAGLALVTQAQAGTHAHGKHGRKLASTPDIKCSEKGGDEMDADYIIKQIQAQSTCYDADQIAGACAFGSSMDTQIAGEAEKVCLNSLKLGKGDKHLLNEMVKRCGKTCDPRNDGTMCIGRQAFCRLDAAKFINSVNDVE